VRYRAILAYDGTAYFGFQRQSAVPTIQAEVEATLERISGAPTPVQGAGRTDTGVHATGQVIAFDLDWRHAPADLVRALNANLPDDIAVRDVEVVRAEFHPRYDARLRRYIYRIVRSPVRDPLRRLYAWHLMGTLDLAAMQAAADHVPGRQDFSAFGSPPVGENPVRTVFEAAWAATDDEMTFTIAADAFLYRMVRRLVGTIAQVGQGWMTLDEFHAILAARQPGLAAAPAPACGLTLTEIKYD
jgi:tRNA pseudouridine38-40 synthase